MSHNEEKLLAEISGGFARVPNLLLEALCCAPLSASEFAVVLLLLRRTCGWTNYTTGACRETTAITAAQIACATGVRPSTVRHALRRLREVKVVLCRPGVSERTNRYGINFEISAWGMPNAWPEFQTQFRRRCEEKVFSRNGKGDGNTNQTPCLKSAKVVESRQDPCRESDTSVVVQPTVTCPISDTEGGGNATPQGDLRSTAPGAEGMCKESSKESIKESRKEAARLFEFSYGDGDDNDFGNSEDGFGSGGDNDGGDDFFTTGNDLGGTGRPLMVHTADDGAGAQTESPADDGAGAQTESPADDAAAEAGGADGEMRSGMMSRISGEQLRRRVSQLQARAMENAALAAQRSR